MSPTELRGVLILIYPSHPFLSPSLRRRRAAAWKSAPQAILRAEWAYVCTIVCLAHIGVAESVAGGNSTPITRRQWQQIKRNSG